MASPVSRFATRLAYGAGQLPRVAWYVGNGLVMRQASRPASTMTRSTRSAASANYSIASAPSRSPIPGGRAPRCLSFSVSRCPRRQFERCWWDAMRIAVCSRGPDRGANWLA